MSNSDSVWSWSQLEHTRRDVPVDKKVGFLLKLVRPAEFVKKPNKKEEGVAKEHQRASAR